MIIINAKYAKIGEMSIGRLEFAVSLSVINLIGRKTGPTNFNNNCLTGCEGSKNQDNNAFAIIINAKILTNHITPASK